MNIFSITLACISIILLGAFYPSLKINFEATFAKKFLIPVLGVAVLSCFTIAKQLGWWVTVIYPCLYIVGSALAGAIINGQKLKFFILDGGLWVIAVLALVLAVAAIII